MGMDALFTAVTGMEANQQMLDVVGNNLANENTTGFQAQQVNFSDLLYQTLNQATGPTNNLGGTDPIQTGTGVQVAGVSTNLQQGTLEATGNDLDMALQGNGYFVVSNGANTNYTRAGSFGIDANGYLIDPSTGDRVQRFGTVGEGGGNLPAFQTAGNNDILLPTSSEIPGAATSNVVLQGNLSASSTGPVAQVLTSAQAFTTAGGAAATSATTLDSLSDNIAQYVNGDSLTLQGVDGDGNAVNVTVPVTAATTLGNLVTDINNNFHGVTASLNASGNLVVQANNTGASNLSVSIADTAGNTGASNWNNHSLAVTTPGAAGTTVQTSIQVYDSAGNAHNLKLTFQKQSDDTWDLSSALASRRRHRGFRHNQQHHLQSEWVIQSDRRREQFDFGAICRLLLATADQLFLRQRRRIWRPDTARRHVIGGRHRTERFRTRYTVQSVDRSGRHHQRSIFQRPNDADRPAGHRLIRQRGGAESDRRQLLRRQRRLGPAAHRRRPVGRPRRGHAEGTRIVQRRRVDGIHQSDHRSARLRGECPRPHRRRSDHARSDQHHALTPGEFECAT